MGLRGDEHLLNGPGLWVDSPQAGNIRWGIVREVIAGRWVDHCHRPAKPCHRPARSCHRLSPSAKTCRALSDFEVVFATIGSRSSCRSQRPLRKDTTAGSEVRVGRGVSAHRLRARLWTGKGRVGPTEGLPPTATSCVGRHQPEKDGRGDLRSVVSARSETCAERPLLSEEARRRVVQNVKCKMQKLK